MRRPRGSLLLAPLLIVAALAFAFAEAPRIASGQPTCPPAASGEAFRTMVRESSLIVLGTLVRTESAPRVTDLGHYVLQPEAFLKGPTRGGEVAYAKGMPGPCDDPGGIGSGQRLLILSKGDAAAPAWPEPGAVYRLDGGQAKTFLRGDTATQAESDLIAAIRGQTNQYSVPAAGDDGGAGIDWGSTIIPVGIAVALLLVAGLFLMRIWHRIDPS